MLSQALPNEIVEASSYMPERSRVQRAKSAYVKLLSSSTNGAFNYQNNDDQFKVLRRSRYNMDQETDQQRPSSSYRRASSSYRLNNEFPSEYDTVNTFEKYEQERHHRSRSRDRSRDRSRSRQRSGSRSRSRARSRSQSRDGRDYTVADRDRSPSDDENDNNERSYPRQLPSAHDLVSNKNATERIKDLEKNNLHLKRMLQLVLNDPSRSIDRIKSAAPRLLVHRANLRDPLGPPVQRHGRIGSSWRHIKQTNNYGNSNILFIDGTVRINDSARYPPKTFGYPPRIANYDEDLIGMDKLELNDLSSSLNANSYARFRARQPSLNSYTNQYADRARKGYKYWPVDERDPANNKRKAKLYTMGSYKTFFGLSDAKLKT